MNIIKGDWRENTTMSRLWVSQGAWKEDFVEMLNEKNIIPSDAVSLVGKAIKMQDQSNN